MVFMGTIVILYYSGFRKGILYCIKLTSCKLGNYGGTLKGSSIKKKPIFIIKELEKS